MGTKMYGPHLGSFGVDLDGMIPGHPSVSLRRGEADKQKTWYQCPSLAYVIEHPEGCILFETGVSPRWNQEWPAPGHSRTGVKQHADGTTELAELKYYPGHVYE